MVLQTFQPILMMFKLHLLKLNTWFIVLFTIHNSENMLLCSFYNEKKKPEELFGEQFKTS